MAACTPISTCTKNVVCLIGNVQRQMIIRVSDAFPQSSCYCCAYPSKSSSYSRINGFQAFQKSCFACGTTRHYTSFNSLTFKSIVSPRRYRKARINVPSVHQNMNLRLLLPKQARTSKIKCNVGPFSWQSAGIFISLLACFSTSQRSYAEAPDGNEKKSADDAHNKKVLTNYSVIASFDFRLYSIRIPGDGRCLFRSVAHGACTRSGKPTPDEKLQRELADELRARVADEFIKRRKETEWFIEGDFDTYVSQMRRPHVWGGEPELLMASHVLLMPITVYIHDTDSGGLISIAEYGQEYGKDNPIEVLYHGYGHYDALHIPGKGGLRPRL